VSFLKTRQMAWDPHWDPAIHGSQAPGVSAGEPRASAATRGVEGVPAAATTHGYGPDLLGCVVEALEGLAEFVANGAARDRGRLARQGFRRYWAWKSRRRRGRPAIRTELRDLIRRMSRANPLWGAPRIHGELLKLGVTVSQATASKYMLRPRRRAALSGAGGRRCAQRRRFPASPVRQGFEARPREDWPEPFVRREP
jgi:hypothetical protein